MDSSFSKPRGRRERRDVMLFRFEAREQCGALGSFGHGARQRFVGPGQPVTGGVEFRQNGFPDPAALVGGQGDRSIPVRHVGVSSPESMKESRL
ncbi:hypothetical protein [Burkholderia sp. 22PA0106]|uniref:hypothetical protein n=1 Tax=Burkholderia sp. 22PA0106 TaxID=3237371 RepID=UPI0039C37B9D